MSEQPRTRKHQEMAKEEEASEPRDQGRAVAVNDGWKYSLRVGQESERFFSRPESAGFWKKTASKFCSRHNTLQPVDL